MKKSKVLLVSDFVGVGKVALSAMIPILNTMEDNISYLPTAVISNNFAYGKAVIKDLTDFMEDSKNVWKELDFQFDIICTGILMNPQQVDIVKEIIAYHGKKNKPLIITDPIMGDNGSLYSDLSTDLIEASRLMAVKADIILPNLTEFCLIIDVDYPTASKLNHDQLIYWLEKSKNQGIKSAIITSVKIGNDYYVYGYSETEDNFRVKIDYIPVEVGGTGDIFTSLIIGRYTKCFNLKECVEYATTSLTKIIREEYKDQFVSKVNEVKIQNHLQYIYQTI